MAAPKYGKNKNCETYFQTWENAASTTFSQRVCSVSSDKPIIIHHGKIFL